MISNLSTDALITIHEFLCIYPKLLPSAEKPFFSERERYTINEDAYREIIKHEKQWRAFLNTSSIFQELRKNTIYLTLAGSYAIRYLEDQEFRNGVDSRVQDRQKQICVYYYYRKGNNALLRLWTLERSSYIAVL